MGYATLDSIRAAIKSSEITGLSANPIITLNGYSAGALSVEWVSSSPKLQVYDQKLTFRLLNYNRSMLQSLRSPVLRWEV
jgi:secretory lipase